jgi:phage gp29-like protein
VNAPATIEPSALLRALIGRRVPRDEQWRTYFGRDLTPARIENAIRSAADGYMSDLTDASTETIVADPHLASVLRKRVGAVSQVDYDLTPAQGDDLDRTKASDIASMVRSQIDQIPEFRQAIEDLEWGHWDGRAAHEIHWDIRYSGRARYHVAELAWIHPRRLSFGPEREIRVIDPSAYVGNFEARGLDTRVPCKFISFKPRLFREYPEREGLAPRCMYWAHFKRFSARERAILIELYGKPLKILEIDPAFDGNVSSDDREAALDQAEALGGVLVAQFAKGVRLKLETPDPKSGDLHNYTISDCDKQISKIVLGSTGTTDATAQGIGGQQARVHQDEQQLVIQADGERISGVIQRDLIGAIVKLNAPFYGLSPADALRYAPKFRLRTEPERDRKSELESMKLFVDLGGALALDEVRERTGYRKPRKDEAIVQMVESPQDDMSARYIPPRPKVLDPSASEPGVGEIGKPGAAAPPPPKKPDGAAPEQAPAATAALEPASPDEDFELFNGPLGPTLAEITDLATPEPSDG